MSTIDDFISRRNDIQFRAENISEEAASQIWQRMGAANRHIHRVTAGELELTPAVAREIDKCLRNADDWLAGRAQAN